LACRGTAGGPNMPFFHLIPPTSSQCARYTAWPQCHWAILLKYSFYFTSVERALVKNCVLHSQVIYSPAIFSFPFFFSRYSWSYYEILIIAIKYCSLINWMHYQCDLHTGIIPFCAVTRGKSTSSRRRILSSRYRFRHTDLCRAFIIALSARYTSGRNAERGTQATRVSRFNCTGTTATRCKYTTGFDICCRMCKETIYALLNRGSSARVKYFSKKSLQR